MQTKQRPTERLLLSCVRSLDLLFEGIESEDMDKVPEILPFTHLVGVSCVSDSDAKVIFGLYRRILKRRQCNWMICARC